MFWMHLSFLWTYGTSPEKQQGRNILAIENYSGYGALQSVFMRAELAVANRFCHPSKNGVDVPLISSFFTTHLAGTWTPVPVQTFAHNPSKIMWTQNVSTGASRSAQLNQSALAYQNMAVRRPPVQTRPVQTFVGSPASIWNQRYKLRQGTPDRLQT